MIDDAWPWKLELARLMEELDRHYPDADFFPGSAVDTESQQIFLVERAAFVTALVLRKLAEAGKVSVQFLSTSIGYERHPIRDSGRTPDQLNMHRAAEFYEEIGSPKRMPYGGFANMLIHSKVFITIEHLDEADDRPAPYGFGVTSDRSHTQYLAVFEIGELRTFVQRLLADHIVQKTTIRDGNGSYVSVGSNKHMQPDELQKFLDRSPNRETAEEIRRLICEKP